MAQGPGPPSRQGPGRPPATGRHVHAHVDQGSSPARGSTVLPGVGGGIHFSPESVASWAPTRADRAVLWGCGGP